MQAGQIGDVTWARSRETHPGPHSRLVLGRGGRRAAARSSTSAATASRSSAATWARGTGRSRCSRWIDTLVHPIEAEDNAIALIRFESGRARPVRGLVDVPRRDGSPRRGRRNRGDDLDEPLPPHRASRCSPPARAGLRRREGGDDERLAVPRRRRGVRARLRRHVRPTCSTRSTRDARRARPSTTATS